MKEIGKDITIITKDICNEFGQKVDKKLQQSIFEAFENSDISDENGNNIKDNKLTGDEVKTFFEKLGVELGQKFQNWYNDKISIEDIINNTQTYDADGKKTVYNKDKYTQAIKSINSDNINDLFFKNGSINIGQEILKQFLNPHFADTENANPRTRDEVAEDCEHIRKVMSEWCKKHGIDTGKLDSIKINYYLSEENTPEKQADNSPQTVMSNYFQLMINYNNAMYYSEIMTRDVSDKMQDAIDKRYEDAINKNEKLTSKKPQNSRIQKSNAREIAKIDKILANENFVANKATRQEIENYRNYGESTLNDPGNGEIDKTATQITGNCWLLAGINALIHTPKGKEFIEKNILKDNEKHIFAVHIQQAENRHLPHPNGDGIYVLTEKEVMESQNIKNGLVSGEGDIAAYALAIERYMKDANILPPEEVNKYYSDGYYIFGLFEMLTGEEIENFDLNSIGIKYDERTKENIAENPLNNFEELQKLVAEQNTAIVLGYKEEHVFSVVGTEGEYLLIQESNNYKAFFENTFKVKEGFPPTYMISKEDYQKYFIAQTAFRWQ